MLDNISSPEALRKEALHIQEYLEITMSEQPEEVVDRGNELAVYIPRTGKMLADAQYHRDAMMQSEIMGLLRDTAKQSLSPSTVNKLVDAACKDANYLATWCERLHKSAVRQYEWCRTLISKAKAEMQVSGGMNNQLPPIDENHIF